MKHFKFSLIVILTVWTFSTEILAQSEIVSKQLEKLKQIRNELKPSESNAAFDNQFKDLEADLSANRLFSSLYKLQTLWLGVASTSYNEKKIAVVQDKLPLLEVEWKKAGGELETKEKQFSPVAIAKTTALVRAIVQAARYRSHPYYTSSILYGKNTNANQGLYYIGFALSNLDLALFNQNLRFQSKKTSLKFVSLDKELTQLEREIIEAYRTSSPDEQSRYNALNSSLKLAQELNEKSWFEGAMLKYLDTVSAFGLLKNSSVNPNEIPEMKTKTDEKLTELSKNKSDHSIGITYLEIAQSLLSSSNTEANLKRIKVILDEVLPKYQNKFRGSK